MGLVWLLTLIDLLNLGALRLCVDLRINTEVLNFTGHTFRIIYKLNVSVERGILWGINVHDIHSGRDWYMIYMFHRFVISKEMAICGNTFHKHSPTKSIMLHSSITLWKFITNITLLRLGEGVPCLKWEVYYFPMEYESVDAWQLWIIFTRKYTRSTHPCCQILH